MPVVVPLQTYLDALTSAPRSAVWEQPLDDRRARATNVTVPVGTSTTAPPAGG